MNEVERLAVAQMLYNEAAKLVSTKDRDSLRASVDRRYKELYDSTGCKSYDVRIGDDAVLALHLGDHVVDIEREQREAAHDEQARRDDRDARKGHEPVREDVFEALTDQEEKSTHSHSRNTHPFRR